MNKPDFLAHEPFDVDQLESTPIAQFQKWFEDAKNVDSQRNLDGACLSTLDTNGYPDGRWVLVRKVSDDGFGFYTNANSTKGKALAKTPRAAWAYYWPNQGKQVRVKGAVIQMSDADSDAYFYSRPLGSQIAAVASAQSDILADRQILFDDMAAMEGQAVTRPMHWVGYWLKPIEVEFWVEQAFRVHDRLVYRRSASGWDVVRLYP